MSRFQHRERPAPSSPTSSPPAAPTGGERLCEMFWELPDDPKSALRWALSKLRRVVDAPDRARIVADRERVRFDAEGVAIDIADHDRLHDGGESLPVADLETMAARLDLVLFDGLDGAGNEAFDSWLAAEREDARATRVTVLRRLATHPDVAPIAAGKWQRLWREADPSAAATAEPAQRQAPADESASAGESDPAAGNDAETLGAQRIGFCQVPDGTKIAFATVGSGPPLLKAANWLNHLEHDGASPIWGKSFAAMARGRTFIRYDERGSGLSDWEVDDLSFDAFVEDLEVVADHLGLERFPLVGISQGCAVSIEYAVRHPERVTGLVLMGGYAAGWRISASREEQARREAVMKLTEVGWGTDNPAYRHIFSQTFMPAASADDLAWFDDFQRKTTSPRNAARFQEAFGHIDVRHRLAEVRAPTIVLHSRDDQRIPLDAGRAIASAIPGAQFLPLESRNHILVEYEPAWKICFDAVTRFLAEKGI